MLEVQSLMRSALIYFPRTAIECALRYRSTIIYFFCDRHKVRIFSPAKQCLMENEYVKYKWDNKLFFFSLAIHYLPNLWVYLQYGNEEMKGESKSF